jgi:adenylosuccinate lyase
MKEIPFLAMKKIEMRAVEKGGDREELHERQRCHLVEWGSGIKSESLKNDLCNLVADDVAFVITPDEMKAVWIPKN